MNRDSMEGGLEKLLENLRLVPIDRIDENESFTILRCRDERGAARVLKYLRSDSADARRRLENEALVMERVKDSAMQGRLRSLSPRARGPRFLLTDYDPGDLLRPEGLREERVLVPVADALAAFQSIPRESLDERITDREPVRTYYRKVLAKHLLHLLPSYITVSDAARSWRALGRSLRAISMRRVICHGDFLPTNLLYHPQDRTVTVTDLEGFMTANHPLFDVVALFTTDGSPLAAWTWQPRFLARYLAAGGGARTGDPCGQEFQHAYRGILTFFLVYRLNESLLHARNKHYFDGLEKRRYLRRRLIGLPRELFARGAADELEPALEIRRRNLRSVLTDEGYERHLRALLEPVPRPILAGAFDQTSFGDAGSRPEPAKP